jgi:hypothetical protein
MMTVNHKSLIKVGRKLRPVETIRKPNVTQEVPIPTDLNERCRKWWMQLEKPLGLELEMFVLTTMAQFKRSDEEHDRVILEGWIAERILKTFTPSGSTP